LVRHARRSRGLARHRWFRLEELADELGPLLTVATLFADGVAVFTYLLTIADGRQVRMSGNLVYDFFMGAILNPARRSRRHEVLHRDSRVVDPLVLADARRCSEAGRADRLPIAADGVHVVAHGLYTNACMKGEECIPSTWDIFHEKWGWMLIFWNLVGVPWFYSFNSYYLAVTDWPAQSTTVVVVLFVALFIAYYIWDTAQSQKNRFRMQERGTFVRRRTFPQLPWAR